MHKKKHFTIIYFMVLFPIVITISLSACPLNNRSNVEKNALYYYFRGMNAYKKKDYSAFLHNLKRAIRLAPNNPRIMYGLARVHALVGNKKTAIRWLERVVRVGYYVNPDENGDFDSIKDLESFKAILGKNEMIKSPINNSKIAFEIPEKDLMPEGIVYDPVDETFYIGSIYKCKIIRIDKNKIIEDFTTEKQDGLWSIAGMKVDAKCRILWVNSAALDNRKGNREKNYGFTGVFKYSLEDGSLVKKYLLDERPTLHLFNDLVINSRGDVFITDSLYGAVYEISHEKDELEMFLRPDRFTYPNGIALSRDEKYLYVTHFEGTSVINVNTKSSYMLSHPEDMTLTQIDGLYSYQNSLIAIQNDNRKGRIVQYFLNEKENLAKNPRIISLIKNNLFFLNKDRICVESARIIESGNPLFMLPTTGVVVGDTFYYIANSQLNSFTDDGTIFPMDRLHAIFILKAKL